MNNKKWSIEEENYLKEFWATKRLAEISNRLQKTNGAVISKAKRLKLGGRYTDIISANTVANVINVDIHCVIGWIKKKGLKTKVKKLGTKKIYSIEMDDLIEWLEKNQDKFDSRRIEYFALGIEPIWLKEKRKKDIKEGHKATLNMWSKDEVVQLQNMFKSGKSYKEIANKLDRTVPSIACKLQSLGNSVWL